MYRAYLTLARKPEQVANHPFHATSFAYQLRELIANRRRHDRVTYEFAVPHDHGQRIVELRRDSRQ